MREKHHGRGHMLAKKTRRKPKLRRVIRNWLPDLDSNQGQFD